MTLNHTHDPAAASWLASANISGGDFQIQNLPLSVFRRNGSADGFGGGVALATRCSTWLRPARI